MGTDEGIHKGGEEKSTGQSMDTQKKVWQNFMLLFCRVWENDT